MMKKNLCRHCKNPLTQKFVDLGESPPSNEYIDKCNIEKDEKKFPLQVFVCNNCWLVQTADFTKGEELFKDDYAYLSSTSNSWIEHCKTYTSNIIKKLSLDSSSFVVELASNDGYLLQHFQENNIKNIGVEPTRGTAEIAQQKGIETVVAFFGENLSRTLVKQYCKADLIIGNNVYAHVPDINDFTRGMKSLLNDEGVITLEFPSLLSLIQNNQFDTIYHEHFSYLSLTSVQKIFKSQNLRIWNVENIKTHGGSLRVYGCHKDSNHVEDKSVKAQLDLEIQAQLDSIKGYEGFQTICESIKSNFRNFLSQARKDNKRVIGYGAAAKGNTLLNFSNIKSDMIEYVCDGSRFKQNKFMPGSKIPILSPDILEDDIPDYVIIFPWNIVDEIKELLQKHRKNGTKIVTFIPEMKIW